MTRKLFISAIFTLFFAGVACMADAAPFQHQLTTDGITFEWSIEKKDITIQLSAETDGWVAIGFNPSEKMKDANFILGYVKRGKTVVADHFGITAHQHKSDKKLGGKENITNIEGHEKDGITTISFSIPLDSGDETDQVLSMDGETTVLLAYGSGRDSFRTRHKFRTALKVNLNTGTFEKIK